MTDCPFCEANWDKLDIVERPAPNFAIVNPLNPVTKGHVLVIHGKHTKSAGDDPHTASDLMLLAAAYAERHELQANIITSIGSAATQTVFHTHVHVVPRREGDGLTLPWTGQKTKRLESMAKELARSDQIEAWVDAGTRY